MSVPFRLLKKRRKVQIHADDAEVEAAGDEVYIETLCGRHLRIEREDPLELIEVWQDLDLLSSWMCEEYHCKSGCFSHRTAVIHS